MHINRLKIVVLSFFVLFLIFIFSSTPLMAEELPKTLIGLKFLAGGSYVESCQNCQLYYPSDYDKTNSFTLGCNDCEVGVGKPSKCSSAYVVGGQGGWDKFENKDGQLKAIGYDDRGVCLDSYKKIGENNIIINKKIINYVVNQNIRGSFEASCNSCQIEAERVDVMRVVPDQSFPPQYELKLVGYKYEPNWLGCYCKVRERGGGLFMKLNLNYCVERRGWKNIENNDGNLECERINTY